MISENIELIIGLVYFFSAFFIAFVADSRGHSFGAAFFASLIITPLIAAILYSPYAPAKTEAGKTSAAVPDSDATNADQLKLKQQYEAGQISTEEYQKRWNELNK